MKREFNFKKGLSVLLVVMLVGTLFPMFMDNSYNVKAETSNPLSVTAYATQEELMTVFVPDADGNATNLGKLSFGKNSNGNDITWYILGKDSSVSGDNIAIFTTSPMATGKAFSSSTATKAYQYEANTGYAAAGGTIEVYSGHYGASDLRAFLQQIGSDTTYFSTVEQGLMQSTTISTLDKKNSITYTVSDKLYALSGSFGETYIYAGGTDGIKLSMASYWSSGALFWLRNPRDIEIAYALVSYPSSAVNFRAVNNQEAVRPATNLNISSVLFASAATALTTDTTEAGVIASGKAMTLRLDGSNIKIGSAIYDDNNGLILVKKDSQATGVVSLVVQGKTGTNNWYYSNAITEDGVITTEDIITSLSDDINLSDISLSDCKIWMEVTENHVTYANTGTSGTIVNQIDVNINTPEGNKPFNNTAECNSYGINSVSVKWTDCDGNDVAGNANYAPWEYVANLTFIPNSGAIILPQVEVSINGGSINIDECVVETDGTLSVKTCAVMSSKAKVTDITIPEFPEDIIFDNYYSQYNILDSQELADSTTVTLDDYEERMGVEWEVVGNYDDTPGAVNTFKWTINLTEGRNYDISTGVVLQGTVDITNKAYSIFDYTVSGYEGTYDGNAHGINVEVNTPATTIYYSRDGVNFLTYTGYAEHINVGTYTVFYKFYKDNYETVTGSSSVKISAKSITVTANKQVIKGDEEIAKDKYTVTGLVEGDSVVSAKLVVNGDKIEVSNITIVNAAGEDVTSNYEITYESGKLVKEDDMSNIVSPDLGNNNTAKWLCISLIAGAIVVAAVCEKRQ